MAGNPKVTVYIPSHNYGKYMGSAIESVLAQTMDSWELLLIDDGSSDTTQEVIARFRNREKIRTFRTEKIGLPAVANLALKEAKGDYIVRLDGDDLFDENALLVLSNYLDGRPEVALVFPDYYLFDEFGEIFTEKRRKKITDDNVLLEMPPNGACTMVRTATLREIGGYREDLGVQDGFDLWTKIAMKYKCGNVNLPLFYYRRHQNNITNNNYRILSAKRKIKNDATGSRFSESQPIIAVIPCRKGFDIVPDLWNQPVGEKTFLERRIEACVQSKLFSRIVVASDNEAVKEVIAKYGDSRLTFFTRRYEDTHHYNKLKNTLRAVAETYDPEFKGIIVVPYLAAPFVGTGTLEEAVSTLILNNANAAFGVKELDAPVYKRTDAGFMPINLKKGITTESDETYQDSYTVLAISNKNLESGYLLGVKTVGFVVPESECYFVNSPLALEIARKIEKAGD